MRTGPVLVLMEPELRSEDRDGSIERQVHLTWEGVRTEMEHNRSLMLAVVHVLLKAILNMYTDRRAH